MSWHPGSWRNFEARQQPIYDDPDTLAAAERELAERPPLVRFERVEALRAALARAQAGEAFLLQGGDCAETFADHDAENVRCTAGLLGRMAASIAAVSGLPVVTVGRMAGQFAKPRSAELEARDGKALPVWRGDIVNGLPFDAAARRPAPERMLRAYAQAQASLAQLSPSFYVSHEALLLPFEQALVRWDQATSRAYAGSADFLWIGERTRFPGSAHVEFARGIANPIGVKCGPSLQPDALLRLLERLDPRREPGRITLNRGMGADRVAKRLPPLVRAVRAEGRPVLWSCDPMHGNTVRTPDGRKTRPLARILGEARAFFALLAAEGVAGAGLHVEMTGRDVAECDAPPTAADRGDGRYRSGCDPRLNPAQAMALAEATAAALV